MSGKIRWLGHSFVEFTTADDKVILFDPWTKDDGNPACPIGNDDIERADLVLVSHDHFDHVGSAAAICSKTGALFGGPVQTVQRFINETKWQQKGKNEVSDLKEACKHLFEGWKLTKKIIKQKSVEFSQRAEFKKEKPALKSKMKFD